MNPALAAGYKSQCQIVRVVTEEWAARNLYCPACEAPKVTRSAPNTQAIDFGCDGCPATYQLKAGKTWNEQQIPDAAYESMLRAIRSDNVPNLLIMQYTTDWAVKNLMLVPSFFFTETAIKKRNPLGPLARRAGWVGCNILLSAISPEGKIRLVTDGLAMDPATVRAQYKKVKPIAELKGGLRGWALNVLRFVHRLNKTAFSLEEMYAFEPELAQLYPANRNVKPKIRQQLQVLRDLGIVTFLGRGQYALT